MVTMVDVFALILCAIICFAVYWRAYRAGYEDGRTQGVAEERARAKTHRLVAKAVRAAKTTRKK